MSTQPPVLIPEDTIRGRLDELARRISSDYAEAGDLVIVGVLRGAFIFMADLTRRLTVPHRVDFVALSSYGASTSTTPGLVRLVKDLTLDIAGCHVLVVEDIVDSGRTLTHLLRQLNARNPASLRTCVLVRKPPGKVVESAKTPPVPVDYVGFEIPDRWVVGYGLDYADRWRTLPYIGVVDTEPGAEAAATAPGPPPRRPE